MSGNTIIPVLHHGNVVGELSLDASKVVDIKIFSDLFGPVLDEAVYWQGADHVNISFGLEKDDYQSKARQMVVDYFNKRVEKTDQVAITLDNVYVVWFSKTLQNWKALLSTTVPDGMYYELTYNGDKNETYIDAYKKFDNVAVQNNH